MSGAVLSGAVLSSVGVIAIPVVLVVLFIVIIFFAGYVKASPDTAIIISGLRKNPKVLIGKAGVKIPFLWSLGWF